MYDIQQGPGSKSLSGEAIEERVILIGWFVPRDTGIWRNNFLDVIIVV